MVARTVFGRSMNRQTQQAIFDLITGFFDRKDTLGHSLHLQVTVRKNLYLGGIHVVRSLDGTTLCRNRYRGLVSWTAHLNHSLVAGLRIVYNICKTDEERRSIVGLSHEIAMNRVLLLGV